jgi:hypothetical protein
MKERYKAIRKIEAILAGLNRREEQNGERTPTPKL